MYILLDPLSSYGLGKSDSRKAILTRKATKRCHLPSNELKDLYACSHDSGPVNAKHDQTDLGASHALRSPLWEQPEYTQHLESHSLQDRESESKQIFDPDTKHYKDC